MEEESVDRHPWANLTTIAKFDEGEDHWTTKCVDNSSKLKSQNYVVDQISSATSLLIESLLQQLCTMLEKCPSRRKRLYFAICNKLHEMKLIDNSYHISDFEMIRNHYQQALYHLVSAARVSIHKEPILDISSCYINDWSRYHQEFQEICFISSGGFGNVFRALNRLDGIEYAIKKIVVKSHRVKSVMQYLAEVKTLARMNHTNIVPYKAAWIEPSLEPTPIKCLSQTNHDRDSHSSDVELSSSDSKVHQSQDVGSKELKSNSLYTKQVIVNGQSEFKEEVHSNSVSFRHEIEDLNLKHSYCKQDEVEDLDLLSNTEESDSRGELNKHNQLCQYNKKRQQCSILYIQMGLCDKTLREWMDERVSSTPQPVITEIVKQILNGLEYIHTLNIVHHDIKPSNIFISSSGKLHIQLGDFGLACPLQSESNHSELGTPMYAAPEQLKGECNPKSDMYSLGIVLIELLLPMQTFMEFSRIVDSVKSGNIPIKLTTAYPKWAVIVSNLLQKDSTKRPSTSELLDELQTDQESVITELKQENKEKGLLINELQEKVLALESEVSRLKLLLNTSKI
ncbi:eukaryotic translation initiation factor 2-alpha kinase 1-like isoform X1 [Leptopilina heterotoma]|uniref:eukaryotic translation initiation factor 2-alpha kinase 1-like isoform X1 n=2 Tax=Leptopilina heterotoma TaxID=63436 RepID=UPI001CA8E844|nr:eukaryotic translation initiation factor 2-alpha kinase 1-like isoform X1 [Leptopilina heterotoma]